MSTAWDNCEITSDYKQSVVNIAEVIKSDPEVSEEEVQEALHLAEKKMQQRIREKFVQTVRKCNQLRNRVYALNEQIKADQQ
jgi:uncharacterized UPF0160 family protein